MSDWEARLFQCREVAHSKEEYTRAIHETAKSIKKNNQPPKKLSLSKTESLHYDSVGEIRGLVIVCSKAIFL